MIELCISFAKIPLTGIGCMFAQVKTREKVYPSYMFAKKKGEWVQVFWGTVNIHMGRCSWVCAYENHKSASSVTLRELSILIFETGLLLELGAHGLGEAVWPGGPRNPPVSASPPLWWQADTTTADLCWIDSETWMQTFMLAQQELYQLIYLSLSLLNGGFKFICKIKEVCASKYYCTDRHGAPDLRS